MTKHKSSLGQIRLWPSATNFSAASCSALRAMGCESYDQRENLAYVRTTAMNNPGKNKLNFPLFSLSAFQNCCYFLSISSFLQRWKWTTHKEHWRKLSTLPQGKPLYAHVNIDVIGCRNQCQMVTRVQPGMGFVSTGGEQDFLASCRCVIISTEPIRAA